ncbi:ionotropic receptor 75a-like [Eurosta solidaginis]|uniref:ionotropic receptor 75a-like n=1 Tax=Eurosta solidaginis TaxID=178769 RepID=UPI0035310C21
MSKEQNVEAALNNARKVMTPLPLNISADITLGVRVDGRNKIQLFDIYKIHPHVLEIEEKGYWSASEGVQLKQRFYRSFIVRRRNLKGLQLRGGIVLREQPDNIDKLDYLKSSDFKSLDTMQRKTYQLMRLLEPMLNMSFVTYVSPLWDAFLPNGSRGGVLGMILSGDIEFSLCPMQYLSNRVKLVRATSYVNIEHIFFIFRHPRHNDIRNIFFEPFAYDVWYAVVAVIVLTTFLLLLHLRHENRFSLNSNRHFQYRIDYALLSIVEAFVMQGPDNNAFAATSTRMLIFFFSVFSIFLQQFYGACIVGSLLTIPPRTITDIESLYNSSLEMGMENIPYMKGFFENSNLPIIHEIYNRRICKDRERHILAIEEGARRIKTGGFAFHVSSNRMYFLLKDILNENEFCDLQEISCFPPALTGISVGKLSPFSDYIASAVIKWHTTGLLQHNENRWRVPRIDCSLNDHREVDVDLEHFLPALLLLFSSMLFSVGALVFEIICNKLMHNTKFKRVCAGLVLQHNI